MERVLETARGTFAWTIRNGGAEEEFAVTPWTPIYRPGKPEDFVLFGTLNTQSNGWIGALFDEMGVDVVAPAEGQVEEALEMNSQRIIRQNREDTAAREAEVGQPD